MKISVYFIMLLLLLVPTIGIKECGRFTTTSDIPCSIALSYHPAGSCSNYNASIFFNSSLTAIQNKTFSEYFPNCNITFNLTNLGVYFWNTTPATESGYISVQADDTLILALLFIPVAVMFMLIYWANSLPEDQEPLKWFMRLFAFLMVIVVYIGAQIAITLNPAYAAFRQIFNILVVGIVFWALIAIFLLYFIIKIFMSFKARKLTDLREGVFK